MKIAFIADIHANIYALKEVLKDIKEANVDRVICLGDLVGYATFPNQVIDLIRQEGIFTIQGNYDEAVGEGLVTCGCDYEDPQVLENANSSLNWTINEVSDKNRKWLRNLPVAEELVVSGRKLLLVHGSPRQNNEYLYRNSPAINAILSEYDFDILACGHTHLPYLKAVGSRYIVNAGSAGKPKHGSPRATYTILDISQGSVDYLPREVEYDFRKTASAVEEAAGMPDAFAELFRKGTG